MVFLCFLKVAASREEVDRDGKGTQKNKKNTSKKRLQSDKKTQKNCVSKRTRRESDFFDEK